MNLIRPAPESKLSKCGASLMATGNGQPKLLSCKNEVFESFNAPLKGLLKCSQAEAFSLVWSSRSLCAARYLVMFILLTTAAFQLETLRQLVSKPLVSMRMHDQLTGHDQTSVQAELAAELL